jgi:uracil-DNA glycosylase family 4
MLYERQKVTVKPEGPVTAKLALLGEAPGHWEIIEGRPFVGPAGSLLGQLLASARIIRSDCYITNVVKEQPPTTKKKTNDISPFIDFRTSGVFESDEYKQYVAELKAELEATSANVIVAFGNVPLYTLTGITPPTISKRRGSVYPSTLLPGRKVVATIHPAACLHAGPQSGGNFLYRYYILHDLRRAYKESQTKEIIYEDIKTLTKPSLSEIVQFLDTIKEAAHEVAFDIEVVNLEVSCISFCIQVDSEFISMSIPFVSHGEEYLSIEDEAFVWNKIGAILEDGSIKKIGQNLVFDTQFIFRKYGIVTKNMDDTMIAHGVLIPDFPKGLDFIASTYTNVPYYKDEGKKYWKIGGDETKFWEYNCKDSAVCSIAMPKLLNDIKIKGNTETYERQKSLIEVLVYMSEHGIRMDVDGLRAESATTGKRIDELFDILNRMAGREINWDASKQVMEYLYDEKQYKEYKNRKTGKRTSDEVALKRLARTGCPEASILLEIRKLGKLKGTYLDVALDEDNRLRCSYNPVGAADSGRLSSSKTIWETGMNMQNDPPAFKKYMLFDEGYIGYQIDLGQAENRLVAYIAPEIKMIQAFEEKRDVHKLTAGLQLGKDPDAISDEPGSCPYCEHPNLCGHTERSWGKQSNHAFNYGRGSASVALKLDIKDELAKRIRDSYHAAYPGVRVMWNWIQEELKRNRTLVNLMGRKRTFMAEWGDELFREAYAFIPSSTVADIIDERGLLYIYNNQDMFAEVELLNQIHDAIYFQIPKSCGTDRHLEIVRNICKSLETPLVHKGRTFVIPADVSVSTTNMKDMKKMKTMEKLEEYLRSEI